MRAQALGIDLALSPSIAELSSCVGELSLIERAFAFGWSTYAEDTGQDIEH
jgi:hypothetical protein